MEGDGCIVYTWWINVNDILWMDYFCFFFLGWMMVHENEEGI